MINVLNCMMYCKDDISLIENYDKAVSDKKQTWLCHHRLETHDKWGNVREEEVTKDILISLRIYCNRPASELIFLTKSEHSKVHGQCKKSPRYIKTPWNKGKTNIYTQDTLKKLSEARKGREPWNKGVTYTEEEKKKMIEAQKKVHLEHPEYWETDAYKNRGAAISKAKKGQTLSLEARQKIAATLKGHYYGHNKKPVLCIETGEVFDSVSAAKRKYKGHIDDVCNGTRNTAAGYHWRYV